MRLKFAEGSERGRVPISYNRCVEFQEFHRVLRRDSSFHQCWISNGLENNRHQSDPRLAYRNQHMWSSFVRFREMGNQGKRLVSIRSINLLQPIILLLSNFSITHAILVIVRSKYRKAPIIRPWSKISLSRFRPSLKTETFVFRSFLNLRTVSC